MDKYVLYDELLNIIMTDGVNGLTDFNRNEVERSYYNNLLFVLVPKEYIHGKTYITLCCLPGKKLKSDRENCRQIKILSDTLYEKLSTLEVSCVTGDDYVYPIGDLKIPDTIKIIRPTEGAYVKPVYAILFVYDYGFITERIKLPLGKRSLEKEFIRKYADVKIEQESFYDYMMQPEHSNGAFDVLLKEYRRRYGITSDEAATISLERKLTNGI